MRQNSHPHLFPLIDNLTTNFIMSPVKEDTPINDFLSYKVSVLYRLLVRRSARFFNQNYDIPVAEWWMLAQLAVESPNTVRGLVDLTHTDKAQVSRALQALEKRGFISRSDNPRDKRSSLVSITPAGEEFYGTVLPIRQQGQSQLLTALTPEEYETTLRSIEKLTQHLLDAPDAQDFVD